ncbi:bifunctional DNA-formamidopyrimidine glycosylase/DNA-(apurinic or apyrimidinic site) lyase [Aquamicrobium sp. LC103]|uniref:bifunctional DNA-formamidopyrimidine glycosylase/DNA-(apurinic or apyrimidinic site) lyase n=1 Tax=Aquamicrobium sp. LC103 TaxID=1120658 RepID=UPI00063E7553|nr:bifunctional DNA-formamidopyrimidine glycosylase/DNA-(apurinic or apyrimidinic site) lyase [Aquamicrobium sp. LC103]TKT74949.1 bifunctional DNA-formamidopyrimidine glycosylase/DNA-(apurinic or apyrimidinic site) lyase [Aquamicrobium sp. LC103]
MPELPEVETVRRGLQPVFEGSRIVAVEQRRPDLRFPFPADFAKRLTGREVISLGRRAKYLTVHLDRDPVLICHLGMSGSFRVETGTESAVPGTFHHERSKDAAHDHVVFRLKGREGVEHRVIFNDPRRFGFMLFAEAAQLDTHPSLAGLGVEPTGNAFDGTLLSDLFRGRKVPLKAALLDQRLIAGLGNIYVCEALWRAGLSPRRAAGSIAAAPGRRSARCDKLAGAIRDVIAEAIAAGGSSLRDYVRADGSLGYFQHSFSVYDREGEPCPKPGCGGTISRIVQSGRSTFYCPACQR